MRYKSYVTIENEEGKIVQENFDNFLEREYYIVIDKEKYAQEIIDNENIQNADECDIRAIIDDYLNEDIGEEILDLVLEMRGEE